MEDEKLAESRRPERGGIMEAKKTEIAMGDYIKSHIEKDDSDAKKIKQTIKYNLPVALSPGQYYFESLIASPLAVMHIENNDIIVVLSTLMLQSAAEVANS